MPSEGRTGKPSTTEEQKLSQTARTKATEAHLFQISQSLRTGLDQNMLRVCVQLCELGVNPEVLATLIRELRKYAPALANNKNQEMDSSPTNRNV